MKTPSQTHITTRGLSKPASAAQHDRARWLEDNSEAVDSSNDYVARYGLPLARFSFYNRD